MPDTVEDGVRRLVRLSKVLAARVSCRRFNVRLFSVGGLSRIFLGGLAGFVLAAAAGHAAAQGDQVWSQEAVSPAINQKGLSVTQTFSAPQPVHPQAVITSVRVQRQTRTLGQLGGVLCTAPGAGRCVVLFGSHTSTQAFNGLPANQTFYLTHTLMGHGPQMPPAFVRSGLSVWYAVGP